MPARTRQDISAIPADVLIQLARSPDEFAASMEAWTERKVAAEKAQRRASAAEGKASARLESAAAKEALAEARLKVVLEREDRVSAREVAVAKAKAEALEVRSAADQAQAEALDMQQRLDVRVKNLVTHARAVLEAFEGD